MVGRGGVSLGTKKGEFLVYKNICAEIARLKTELVKVSSVDCKFESISTLLSIHQIHITTNVCIT
jgi:hypothetical protein